MLKSGCKDMLMSRTHLQVVAVGSGKANEKGDVVKPTLSKGDTVLYQKYSGVDFEGQDEKQYVVLKENDILAALA